jgi:hypothetical protein
MRTAEAPEQNPSGKAASRGTPQDTETLSTMPIDRADVVCKHIYDFLVQKGFTKSDGHLLADVFADVWSELSDRATGRQKAQDRFKHLLCSAPQYFIVFRKNVRFAKFCGRFVRKGEVMVRLVL